MSLKIKFKGGHATVRWKHPMEKEAFKQHMCLWRDSDPKTHPPIHVKDESNKEIIIQPPMPLMKSKPQIVRPKEKKE